MLDLFRTLPILANEIEDAEPIREAIVFAAWRRVAGEGLWAHAAPLRLQNATLSIAVSNLTWQRHLKDLASQMLFKLNALLGAATVSYIEFEINEAAVIESRGERDTVDEADARRLAEQQLTPELRAAALKIEDEELRTQFLAAAGNCLVRKARKQSRTI
jgi:hypothetical protein